MNIIDKIEKEQMKPDFADFGVGDSVKVHTRVVEGGKERIQLFAGIVIGRRGTGVGAAFTVRKISYGEGVERVFLIHSPKVAKLEVTKRGKVRRAKLNYLRDRVGKKATNVKAAADQRMSKKAKAVSVPSEGEGAPEPEPEPVVEAVADAAPAAEAEAPAAEK